MAVSKIVRCAVHRTGYRDAARKFITKTAPGCADCAAAKRDQRYLVQTAIPGSGNKSETKTVVGLRHAEDYDARRRLELKTSARPAVAEIDRDITFRDFAPKVFAARALAQNTRAAYTRQMDRNVYPELGDVKIRSLTSPLALRTVLANIERASGKPTRHFCEARIRTVLNAAVAEGLLPVSPLKAVPFSGYERARGKPYAPDYTEIGAARQALGKLRMAEPDRTMFTAIVDTLAGTGMRVSEVLGLGDGDLNELTNSLRVSRQLSYHEPCEQCRTESRVPYVLGPPKTDEGSMRDIPAPDFVVRALAATTRRNGVRSFTLPWEEPHGSATATVRLLFHRLTPTYTHLPLAATNVQHRLQRLGQVAKLPRGLHPHALRHAFTTRLDDDGVSMKVIDAITGHVSTGSTSLQYAHVTKRKLDYARQVIEAAWAEDVTRESTAPAAAPTIAQRRIAGR